MIVIHINIIRPKLFFIEQKLLSSIRNNVDEMLESKQEQLEAYQNANVRHAAMYKQRIGRLSNDVSLLTHVMEIIDEAIENGLMKLISDAKSAADESK